MAPAYQIDQRWRIVKVNDAFCRAFKCAEAGVIGRDVRDLMRQDWRLDFRRYVSQAYDRFAAPVEERYSAGGTRKLAEQAGLRVRQLAQMRGWVVWAEK